MSTRAFAAFWDTWYKLSRFLSYWASDSVNDAGWITASSDWCWMACDDFRMSDFNYFFTPYCTSILVCFCLGIIIAYSRGIPQDFSNAGLIRDITSAAEAKILLTLFKFLSQSNCGTTWQMLCSKLHMLLLTHHEDRCAADALHSWIEHSVQLRRQWTFFLYNFKFYKIVTENDLRKNCFSPFLLLTLQYFLVLMSSSMRQLIYLKLSKCSNRFLWKSLIISVYILYL